MTRAVASCGRIWLTLPDGGEYELRGDAGIGRDGSNDLVFSSPTVSRRHARVVAREGRSWIEDSGSFNGTFVNGVRARGDHRPADAQPLVGIAS